MPQLGSGPCCPWNRDLTSHGCLEGHWGPRRSAPVALRNPPDSVGSLRGWTPLGPGHVTAQGHLCLHLAQDQLGLGFRRQRHPIGFLLETLCFHLRGQRYVRCCKEAPDVLTHYPGDPLHRALRGGTGKAPSRRGPHPGVCGTAWSSPGKRPSAGIQNEQSRMLLSIPRCVVWDRLRGRHRCLPDVTRARAERPRVHQ